MSILPFNSQKIEQLLNSATSSRQRQMYQALLDKARKQERSSTNDKTPETTPSTEKKALTTTQGKTKTKTKTAKKNKKATNQSATTSADTETKQSTKTGTESSPLQPKTETPHPASSAIDLSPQTEPKSQSQKTPSQQSEATPTIFQALGAVMARPYLDEELLKVAINGSEYDLFYAPGYRRKAYILLRDELEKNDSREMFLRLYPQVKYDYKSQQPLLSFSLVNFSQEGEEINNEPLGFVLRGIWQYIPHCKSPVISIYRNEAQRGAFNKLNKLQQLSFAQPRHLPVVWSAPVEPFKFLAIATKDEQMPRYFVQVRAIFKDGLYVVEEMLQEPTLKIPKFIKLSKKEAAQK